MFTRTLLLLSVRICMSVFRLFWLGFFLLMGGISASAADLTVTDGRTTLSVDELKAGLLGCVDIQPASITTK